MIERLKDSVENKFGKKIASQKDCKLLSINILETIGEYLSPATIRRVYGFLLTNSNLSRVTHDILCRYVGMKDWEHFLENNRVIGSSQSQIIETWVKVQEKSKKISSNTLDNIKIKSGINFCKTIHREFIDNRLTIYLNSNFNSTAIIGPGGFGKSILLASWYEKNSSKNTYSNDIILFIQAISLQSFANSEAYFEDWLMRQLGLSSDYNFLRNILSSKILPPGRFIIIVDALDESNLQSSKLEKIYSSLADFSLKFSSTKWLKIIISMRFCSWYKFLPFIENEEKWYYTENDKFTADAANIPLLSSYEVQKVLDNTINAKFPRKTLIDEFSHELKQILLYPYFLQLFINIYHPNDDHLLSDPIEILKEFLNKQIYSAQYSEEKVDIISKILELSEYGLAPDRVLKSALKEIYPVHLKLASNYFAAYEDLISFGIIIEEDIETKFGGHSKTIKIANRRLFEILIAKSYLEEEENITFSLFKRVAEIYADHPLLPQIIIRLYQFAYKDRILEPLKSFFQLNISALNSALSGPEIAIALRKDEYLRKILLPIYVNNPIGRKYFFENYPDINNITNSFSYSLNYCFNQANSKDSTIGNILNIYAGFLSLDDGRVKRYFSQMNGFVPSKELNLSITGKWFACKYLYSKLLKNDDAGNEMDEALSFLNELRLTNGYLSGSFESAFCLALVIANQYDILNQLTSVDEMIEVNQSGASNKELKLFRYYCKLNTGYQLDYNDIAEIDFLLSHLNPLDSYMLQILGQVIKAIYYMNNNEMTKAYENYRISTELSNIAGYRLVEVKLIKNLSNALLKLGEITKSIECNKFAESITHKTGFNYELL